MSLRKLMMACLNLTEGSICLSVQKGVQKLDLKTCVFINTSLKNATNLLAVCMYTRINRTYCQINFLSIQTNLSPVNINLVLLEANYDCIECLIFTNILKIFVYISGLKE